MATIRPFKAIHPNPFYADQLVFTTPEAESVAGDITKPEGLPPLKTLLETAARQRPETPDGQTAAYKEISDTLKYLLESERLWQDKETGIYIYEVKSKYGKQVGIWALTDINDLIKTHELTFSDSVRRMKNYRENMGLEGSPVLLTYPPDTLIDDLITETRLTATYAAYGSQTAIHKLWKIEDSGKINDLVNAFARIEQIYMADGHHRLKSAVEVGGHQFLSSLYMSTNELKTNDYHRIIIPEVNIDKTELFKQLVLHFYLHEVFNDKPSKPGEERRMGLYIDGKWHYMTAKPHTYTFATRNILDVEILQNYVLAPLFGITDPGKDARLKYVGGDKAIAEMKAILKESPDAICFTLFPLTIIQLTDAAANGINLPPKSTWIDPKVPYGLLLYKH